MKKLVLLTCCLAAAVLATAQMPKLTWAKSIGGSSYYRGASIKVDASGNVYTTGNFTGTADFDPGPGTFNLTAATAGGDIFISKLDASGNFVWAKSIGSIGNDVGSSILVDASGNVYITGYFAGFAGGTAAADFDPGSGTFNLTSAGDADIFILKLNASGNFVWAKSMGGTSYDYASSIAVDASGNVYTTGAFEGTADFDPGTGINNLTSPGYGDIFISKLDASGNFVWAKSLEGSTLYDAGTSIVLDASGNVYTTGYFGGTIDFDPGTGTNNLTSASADLYDIFILKLNVSGNFVWAKSLGGTLPDNGFSIALDASGNVYTTGSYQGTADFDPGAATSNLTSAGGNDIFISKLDATGNFVWAKSLGGTTSDLARTLALDVSGNVYTTGNFTGTVDFDPGTGTSNLTSVGNDDIFISKLDASGKFVWAKSMGGNKLDQGHSLAVDASNNFYITGTFSGTADFDPGSGTFNLSTTVSQGSFVVKMSQTAAGIKENPITNTITIYPNPTNGILNVECSMVNNKEITIQFLNSMGQIVLEENQLQHSQFNIQHLPEGLYLVKVLNNNTLIATQKIIKN